MATIAVQPIPGQMGVLVTAAPAFPGDHFSLGVPECIGDAAAPIWFGGLVPAWSRSGEGLWVQRGERPGELRYALTVRPAEDYVDIEIDLTNLSPRPWQHGMAFNCFNCGASVLCDHECLRHWVGLHGHLTRLTQVPRVFGPRPAIQLYSVEGAPPGRDIPFVANFAATPADVALEGWMAIAAPDGRRLVAAASRPALFLFQNMEYSCIHSGPDFGLLAPGATARALTRLYFVAASLGEWHARVQRELSSPAP